MGFLLWLQTLGDRPEDQAWHDGEMSSSYSQTLCISTTSASYC